MIGTQLFQQEEKIIELYGAFRVFCAIDCHCKRGKMSDQRLKVLQVAIFFVLYVLILKSNMRLWSNSNLLRRNCP